MDTYSEERATFKYQVSLLDLTLEAGIPDDVMWLFMDGKHIVSVLHHDGLLVDRVDNGPDEDIDGMAADFAMWLNESTLAALDRTTRELKRLSESVPNGNDRQTCFESVMLSVRVGVYGVSCHLDPMIPPDMMMVGGSGVFYHLDSFMVTLDLMTDIHIRC